MPLYGGVNEVVIHRAPIRHGQSKQGVEEGPDYLVSAGVLKKIEERGLKLAGNHDLRFEIPENLSNMKICSKMSQLLSDSIFENAKNKRFCLNLGGDHSIGTGTLSGMLRAYPDLCVIWIDAHTDINNVSTSPSQNVHGMPVSFIVDDKREKSLKVFPKEYEWCRKNLLSPSRLAYIGIRQADPGEVETVKDLNIFTINMETLERKGVASCITEVLQRINPTLKSPIHVSFDVDSLDPSLAPATGTPVPGGLTLREILYIAEAIYDTGCLAGMDIVEFNPKLCNDQEKVHLTAKNTISVLEAFLGEARPRFG